MLKQSTRTYLLTSTMIGGVTLATVAVSPAFAQSKSADQPATVEEVVITGSRIPQPNLTSVSPLTAVNSQEIKAQGTTGVENLINTLPQAFAAQTGGVSNGSTGTATVNLRGLGSTRTLVLVDGRRMMPGDPATPVADLNNIPAALVNRVDVVSGGASAVYGSDAIAGVVNFQMVHDFEGVRIDGQYSFAQHSNGNSDALSALKTAPYAVKIPTGDVTDGGTTDVSIILGANAPDGKGNITAYGSYRHTEAVLQGNRDYSACSIATSSTVTSNVYDTHFCAGSSNSAYGRFMAVNTATGVTGTPYSTNPNGQLGPLVPFTNAARFNYGPQNYFQRPDDRYTAGFFGHYQVNKQFDLYSNFMFADDHTVAQIAPSGLFRGTGPNLTSTYKINCDNPLMAAAKAQLCTPGFVNADNTIDADIGFRFAALPRQDDLRHTNYMINIGSRGELGDGWNYDVYAQYGTSIFNEHYNNDVSTVRVQNALLVDPVTGQCKSGTTDGCVPLNIFQYGALSPAMLKYVIAPGFKSGQTTEQVVSGSVTGDLGQYGVKTPWANDGVGVAFGSEYRRESLDLRTDLEFASGDLSGQGGPSKSNSGSFDVYELFGEARIPIAQGQPFIKDLSAEVGYRFSDYSTAAGVTHTYKVGLDYAPIDDIRFRASYNRAVRAPNVAELYTPLAVGLFGGTDPCAGASPVASLALCQTTGVTPAQYGHISACPSSQCSALLGGNADLQAEKSDTYSVGFVFTPTFLSGFNLTVDYFNIKVANVISQLPNLTVISCLNGSAQACGLFHRDPATGQLFGNNGYIIAPFTNTGFLKTSGVDLEANYRFGLADVGLSGWGSVALNLVGTWTNTFETQPVTGGGSFDCVGYYGPICSTNTQGGPIPEWRHKFRATWTTPWPVTVSLAWRYISSVSLDANTNDPFMRDPAGRKNTKDASIPAYNWIDLSGTWKVRDGLTFRAGVNNVFDKDPPILDSNNYPISGSPFGNGNTFPGTYDYLGRTIFVGLTADF